MKLTWKRMQSVSTTRALELDALFSDLTLWVTVTAVLSLDYAMPLVAGAIAALSPYLISDLITALAVTKSPPTAPEVVALPAAGLN
ncbi:hypothetical protein FALB51S_02170 [Frigidibacter albus]